MKKRVAVLFGGQSSEHEISCISAKTIVDAIDKNQYDVLLIGITKEGRWLFVDHASKIADGSWRQCVKSAVLSPDAGMKSVLIFHPAGFGESTTASVISIDAVFPVLHGMYGEDGTVQGLLELARLPYVGCGVLASAVSMDKLYTKWIVERLGICQAAFVPVSSRELALSKEEVARRVEEKLQYPVFVKPSNAGSSRGVSKAGNRAELMAGLALAAQHDRKILVEECIVGRELECAVLGGYALKEEESEALFASAHVPAAKAAGPGEIFAAAEFYDYDAKYNSEESRTILSPTLPEGKKEEIQRAAERIFAAVDGYGLARVDFFLREGSNEVVFNEINTMPGFTAISMYHMLWEAEGISKKELVSQLLALAFARGENGCRPNCQ